MDIIEQIKTKNLTLLGKDITLKGEIHLSGDVRVYGKIEGTIFFHGDGILSIEKDAQIIGNLFANNVEIWGKFEGTIDSKGSLILRSGSIVSGEFKSNKLAIYPGAIVNSNLVTN